MLVVVFVYGSSLTIPLYNCYAICAGKNAFSSSNFELIISIYRYCKCYGDRTINFREL